MLSSIYTEYNVGKSRYVKVSSKLYYLLPLELKAKIMYSMGQMYLDMYDPQVYAWEADFHKPMDPSDPAYQYAVKVAMADEGGVPAPRFNAVVLVLAALAAWWGMKRL